jgi:hypothetical protein
MVTAAGAMMGTDTPMIYAMKKYFAKKSKSIRNLNPDMKYRIMGKTGIYVSALGFGTLRFPMLKDRKTVDEKLAVEIVRHAIDHGLNYMDAAYAYNDGQSEQTLGKALQDGYRDRVYLTSKSPWWMMERPEDFERIFDESRNRLRTDVVDFYHIHFVNNKAWNEKIIPFRLIEKIEKLKQDGKIRFSGFSFHDSMVMFKKAVDANPDWNFCLIQQNYLDTEHEAGLIGLKYAASKGLGVSIMEPLRNGFLVTPPKEVQAIFDASTTKRSPVEWALDYLWNMPEVSVVLSGMSTMQQVKDNLEYSSRSSIDMLDINDVATIGQAVKLYQEYDGVMPCTGCYNCLPCHNNVAIGYIFSLVYNQYKIDNNLERAKQLYNCMPHVLRGFKASVCDSCGECVPRCPQGINIPQALHKVREELGA